MRNRGFIANFPEHSNGRCQSKTHFAGRFSHSLTCFSTSLAGQMLSHQKLNVITVVGCLTADLAQPTMCVCVFENRQESVFLSSCENVGKRTRGRRRDRIRYKQSFEIQAERQRCAMATMGNGTECAHRQRWIRMEHTQFESPYTRAHTQRALETGDLCVVHMINRLHCLHYYTCTWCVHSCHIKRHPSPFRSSPFSRRFARRFSFLSSAWAYKSSAVHPFFIYISMFGENNV